MKSTQWLDLYNILLLGRDSASVSTALCSALEKGSGNLGSREAGEQLDSPVKIKYRESLTRRRL